MKIPGLVDLQVNGYKGISFSDEELTAETCVDACRQMLASGVTAFLPTMITSPERMYERNLKIMGEVMDAGEFKGRLLGVHIEGPFISPEDGPRGAHDKAYVRAPDLDYLKRIVEWGGGKVRILTIAAERPGAEKLARYAVDQGIVVSLGHQMATAEDLNRLIDAGARALTHLGNGMPLIQHRHNNLIWAGLAEDRLTAMMIPDGHHLPAALIKVFLRAKGVERCIAVSDASALAGMPAGKYHVHGNNVILDESGRVYNPDTGYMVGSSATILGCANHLASTGLLPVEKIIDLCYYNPLKLIGAKPGDIAAGPKISYDKTTGKFSTGK